jgi:predicted TIM-barrel fold metal-dependent hydrolase
MRTITLEEHFVTESFLRATQENGHGFPPQLAQMQSKLLDLGAGRIAAMDEAAIDLQVLSLAALGFDELDPATATALARDINDELAEATRTHPTRFAGFAALALKDPSAAAAELVMALLERCSMAQPTVCFLTMPAFCPSLKLRPIWECRSIFIPPLHLRR